MKKTLVLALFLSILINSHTIKQESTISRINKPAGVLKVSQFIRENMPIKQMKFINNSKTKAGEIKAMKNFLNSALDFLVLDPTTLQKIIDTSNVTSLMKAMDVCVIVANGDSKAIVRLKDIFTEINTDWKLEKQSLQEALDFIKNNIHTVLSDQNKIKAPTSEETFQFKETLEQNSGLNDVKVKPSSVKNKLIRKMDKKTHHDDSLQEIANKKLEDSLNDELRNDEKQNSGPDREEALEKKPHKIPILRKKSSKNSYAFIEDEKQKQSESEESKAIKLLTSNVKNLKEKLDSFELQSQDLLEKLDKQNSQFNDILKNSGKDIQNIKNQLNTLQSSQLNEDQIIKSVMTYINKNGIDMGDRWKINSEGTVLVFRDMITSKTKDSRFAMYPNRYVDV